MQIEAVSMVERPMQEDYRWDMGVVSDMCEGWRDDVRQGVVDLVYYDEETSTRLGPSWLKKGECEKLEWGLRVCAPGI